jgi:hypothetical protein
MALKNPYILNQHQNIKTVDDRLTSTSGFPLIKQPFDDNIDLSNQIITTTDNDKNSFYPISSDVNSSLFNQENTELLPTSSEILTNVNHSIISVDEQKIEYNGSFVSHIPMMSSSSSSSSSITQLTEEIIEKKFQPETSNLNDPRTRSIIVGQETLIEIDREQSGLGLSVVGGSDTQLVNTKFTPPSKRNKFFFLNFSLRLLFMIFMKVVLHNVMDV